LRGAGRVSLVLIVGIRENAPESARGSATSMITRRVRRPLDQPPHRRRALAKLSRCRALPLTF
jgi:hypothetical protein